MLRLLTSAFSSPRLPRGPSGLAFGVALVACGVPGSEAESFATRAVVVDAQLPDATVPDGYVLTELGSDGATTSVDPSKPCDPSKGPDAADEAADEAAPGLAALLDASLDRQACATAPGPGDLVLDEVMIATEPGSEDRGQWVEVKSTRSCAIDLVGLHASAPHGESFRTMDVAGDVWLAPGGFFLVADTTDPTENNSLPGLVFAWSGAPADALHKTADSITLSLGSVTLDTLSYPSRKWTEGTSLSFPASCRLSLRADFSDWKASTASWTPGFFGTPGAPNTDVRCAVPTVPTCAGKKATGPAR